MHHLYYVQGVSLRQTFPYWHFAVFIILLICYYFCLVNTNYIFSISDRFFGCDCFFYCSEDIILLDFLYLLCWHRIKFFCLLSLFIYQTSDILQILDDSCFQAYLWSCCSCPQSPTSVWFAEGQKVGCAARICIQTCQYK